MGRKMRKSSTISEEELKLFHEAMKGIRPHRRDKTLLLKKKGAHRPYRPELKITPILSEALHLPPVTSDEHLSFKRAGISDKTLRNLRKGKYNVDAVLDLHGMTVDEANVAVGAFIQQCIRREKRVVLIIHGKGRHGKAPILKNKLNHWLRAFDLVLAFCSASLADGGSGATYILLKNQRGMMLE